MKAVCASFSNSGAGYSYEMEALENMDAEIIECPTTEEAFIAAAKGVYELLGAADRLSANYPDCDHNFPDEVRDVAYRWLDRWLKK